MSRAKQPVNIKIRNDKLRNEISNLSEIILTVHTGKSPDTNCNGISICGAIQRAENTVRWTGRCPWFHGKYKLITHWCKYLHLKCKYLLLRIQNRASGIFWDQQQSNFWTWEIWNKTNPSMGHYQTIIKPILDCVKLNSGNLLKMIIT